MIRMSSLFGSGGWKSSVDESETSRPPELVPRSPPSGGIPNASVRKFAEPQDLDVISPVMQAHQKNAGGNERIRTYNFPQNRVTDHRIELTLYNLPTFIDGDIDSMIEPLMANDLDERLKALQL